MDDVARCGSTARRSSKSVLVDDSRSDHDDPCFVDLPRATAGAESSVWDDARQGTEELPRFAHGEEDATGGAA